MKSICFDIRMGSLTEAKKEIEGTNYEKAKIP